MTRTRRQVLLREVFFPADDARDRLDEIEADFFARIRLRNGAFKTTRRNRLDDVNAFWLDYLPQARPIRIADVAISSGITTLELADFLDRNGIEYQLAGCDAFLHGFLVVLSGSVWLLFDTGGHLLQMDIADLAFPSSSGDRLKNLVYRTASWLLGRFPGIAFADNSSISRRRLSVPLLSWRLRRESNLKLSLIEDDLLRPSPSGMLERFDCIRAANILNREYFTDQELRRMTATLKERLKPSGVLLVAKSRPDGVNLVTVFRKMPAGGFEVIARMNGGVPVENLVASG